MYRKDAETREKCNGAAGLRQKSTLTRHIAAYQIESRTFHVKQQKNRRTLHFWGARNKETALRHPNTSSSEHPKHYLTAHPITLCQCIQSAPCRHFLITACRMSRKLLADVFRELFCRYVLSTPHWRVRSCHFPATQNRSHDNAHTKCPALRYF